MQRSDELDSDAAIQRQSEIAATQAFLDQFLVAGFPCPLLGRDVFDGNEYEAARMQQGVAARGLRKGYFAFSDPQIQLRFEECLAAVRNGAASHAEEKNTEPAPPETEPMDGTSKAPPDTAFGCVETEPAEEQGVADKDLPLADEGFEENADLSSEQLFGDLKDSPIFREERLEEPNEQWQEGKNEQYRSDLENLARQLNLLGNPKALMPTLQLIAALIQIHSDREELEAKIDELWILTSRAMSAQFFDLMGLDNIEDGLSAHIMELTAERKEITHWVQNTAQALAITNELTGKSDLYFCNSLRQRPKLDDGTWGPLSRHERVSCDNAAGSLSVMLEFDIRGEHHQGLGYFPDEATALAVLPPDFPATVVIHSGYGIQARYVAKEHYIYADADERAWVADVLERFFRVFEGLAKQCGCKLDPSFDLARVGRIPGTFNHKGKPPKLVKIIQVSGKKYNLSELEEFADRKGIPHHARPADDPYAGPVIAVDRAIRIPNEVIAALCATDEMFRRTWNYQRTFQEDQGGGRISDDNSSYDFALINFGFDAGWTDQEIANLLIHHRSRSSRRSSIQKLRRGSFGHYLRRSINKARTTYKAPNQDGRRPDTDSQPPRGASESASDPSGDREAKAEGGADQAKASPCGDEASDDGTTTAEGAAHKQDQRQRAEGVGDSQETADASNQRAEPFYPAPVKPLRGEKGRARNLMLDFLRYRREEKGDRFAQREHIDLYRYGGGRYVPDVGWLHAAAQGFFDRYGAQTLCDAEVAKWGSCRLLNESPAICTDTPGLICLRDCLLDPRTMHTHPHTPEWLHTTQVNVLWGAPPATGRGEEFLQTVLGDDKATRDLVDCLPLWCARGGVNHQQTAFMLTGTGNNGKSTLLNWLSHLLGKENVSGITIQDLEQRFRLFGLVDKLANIFADLPQKPISDTAVGIFKAITGGDLVTVEKKYASPYSLHLPVRLLFSANQIPRSSDTGDAFLRRWKVIPFRKTFTRDDALGEELRQALHAPSEIAGWFRRSLTLQDLIAGPHTMPEPAASAEAKEAFRRSLDPIAAFVTECLTFVEGHFLSWEQLRAAFREFCNSCTDVNTRKAEQTFESDLLNRCTARWPGVTQYRPDIPGRPRGVKGLGFLSNRSY